MLVGGVWNTDQEVCPEHIVDVKTVSKLRVGRVGRVLNGS